MNRQKILATFKKCGALLEGHFRLSSGMHSSEYLQCAQVLEFPKTAEKLTAQLAEDWRDKNVEIVLGPAMGGILFAYELARQLGTRAMFAERADGCMQLRRGFALQDGARILVAEDVVTTGGSVIEVIKLLRSMNCEVVGVAALVDRSVNTPFDVPFVSLVKVSPPLYDPDDCPLCAEGIAIDSPGSKYLK